MKPSPPYYLGREGTATRRLFIQVRLTFPVSLSPPLWTMPSDQVLQLHSLRVVCNPQTPHETSSRGEGEFHMPKVADRWVNETCHVDVTAVWPFIPNYIWLSLSSDWWKIFPFKKHLNWCSSLVVKHSQALNIFPFPFPPFTFNHLTHIVFITAHESWIFSFLNCVETCQKLIN